MFFITQDLRLTSWTLTSIVGVRVVKGVESVHRSVVKKGFVVAEVGEVVLMI